MLGHDRHPSVIGASNAKQLVQLCDGSTPSRSRSSRRQNSRWRMRLGVVPLRQVHPDQGAVGALPQRLAADRRERRPECPPEVAGGDELVGERLECVKAQLAKTLPFDE